MDHILEIILQFYGLDWMAMVLGLGGTYMIANQDKRGFVLNGAACICGLSVAVMSGQGGFIAYNAILVALMGKGFLTWGRNKPVTVKIEA